MKIKSITKLFIGNVAYVLILVSLYILLIFNILSWSYLSFLIWTFKPEYSIAEGVSSDCFKHSPFPLNKIWYESNLSELKFDDINYISYSKGHRFGYYVLFVGKLIDTPSASFLSECTLAGSEDLEFKNVNLFLNLPAKTRKKYRLRAEIDNYSSFLRLGFEQDSSSSQCMTFKWDSKIMWYMAHYDVDTKFLIVYIEYAN